MGDKYKYTSKGKTYTIDIEEVHLSTEGNGHIYFNYMKDYMYEPEKNSGQLTKVSGSGDDILNYSSFTVKEFRDENKVREDLAKAKRLFEEEGFYDTEYFVSPYGSKDLGLQQIIKKSGGYKCLVSTSGSDYMGNNGKYGRYEIQRFSFDSNDSPGRELSTLKAIIDETSSNNGWLLICTHIYNGWTEQLKSTRFKEFVNYAKEKKLRFVTLKEGFEQFRPVFEHYQK